jgi:ParB-like chromosome segregation protein Spo0J
LIEERRFALTDADARRLQLLLSSTVIERVQTKSLVPYKQNAKDHPQRQIQLLAENIRKFGFTQPILADENNEIVAGHARLEAAKRLRLPEVPVVRLTHLNSDQKRALRLSDNKLSELSSWNLDNLKVELEHLSDPALELEIDPFILGFETVEIDNIIVGRTDDTGPDPADILPPFPEPGDATTQHGDLWACAEQSSSCRVAA